MSTGSRPTVRDPHLSSFNIAETLFNTMGRPPLQEIRSVNEQPPANERQQQVAESTNTSLTRRRNLSPGPQRESPQPGRTPVRPTRPTSTSNTNQLQQGVNACLKQLREVNKANIEMKKSQATTNRRMTDLENSISRVEKKVDQIIKQAAPANNGTCSSAGANSTGGYSTVEEIAPHLRVPSETLTRTHRKSHGAGHFATLLLPVIFPELFGPKRTRLQYNWDGTRAKQAMDSEKKNVLKTYTHIYYPESRTDSSWVSCVAKINECLRRKYVPKGQQLQSKNYNNHDEQQDNDDASHDES